MRLMLCRRRGLVRLRPVDAATRCARRGRYVSALMEDMCARGEFFFQILRLGGDLEVVGDKFSSYLLKNHGLTRIIDLTLRKTVVQE